MNYTYRADGVKVKKVHHYFSGKKSQDAFITTEYVDGFQYSIDTANLDLLVPNLKFFATSEGYFDFVNNRYIYHYNDHLGNVRVSFAREGNMPVIVQQNDYYAFGLRHSYGISAIGDYKYQYNGKELQEELGMYDYGARFYMPDLGRWEAIDPLAEMYTSHSPYHYAVNNPMRFIDPDGRSSQTFEGQDAVNAYWHLVFGGSISSLNGGSSFGSLGGQEFNLSSFFHYIDPGGSSGGGSSLSPWMQSYLNFSGFGNIADPIVDWLTAKMNIRAGKPQTGETDCIPTIGRAAAQYLGFEINVSNLQAEANISGGIKANKTKEFFENMGLKVTALYENKLSGDYYFNQGVGSHMQSIAIKFIVDSLEANHPVYLGFSSKDMAGINVAHAVLVTEIKYTTDYSRIKSITYYDPMTGRGHEKLDSFRKNDYGHGTTVYNIFSLSKP